MQIKDKIKSKIDITKSFYQRYERIIPIISFFAGFTWDSLTLRRIDHLSDSLILLLYIILLGLFLILLVFSEKGFVTKPILLKYSEWYPALIQFFIGGLFSAYVVFYFQSASFTKTSLFLIILVGLLVANEFLHDRLSNLYLILSLYFFALSSFFIFFLPIIFGAMNTFVFFVGVLISVLIIGAILYLFYSKKIIETKKQLQRYSGLILGLFLLLNLFYIFNWIPPVPLSMKYAGIYHNVQRNNNIYELKHEQPAWYQLFKSDDSDFYYVNGDIVYCFVAVFAPTDLNKKIEHQWQIYSKEEGEWLTSDRRGYELSGGREGGYRGYTLKKNIKQGEWRVNIITEDDLLLGRINFDVISSTEKNREWEILKK